MLCVLKCGAHPYLWVVVYREVHVNAMLLHQSEGLHVLQARGEGTGERVGGGGGGEGEGEGREVGM